ncbi:hypothetical protein [Nitrospirillum amazonense]|uniref:hypothetical protein n=1 Tax=Nitrospirillum amazonense TaxID=28077 RepID=UPI002412260B|nr:hypothetical protein [Nitrospirillum amazonense]MDG3444163.1 hypothetical protein [Nitrospirillum amazonense]
MKRKLFNNYGNTLEESRAKERRRYRLAFRIRESVLSMPKQFSYINEGLYLRVRNLYFATFATLIALLASIFPYLFVAACDQLHGINVIKITILRFGTLYFFAFTLMIATKGLSFFIGSAMYIIMPIFPTRIAGKIRNDLVKSFSGETFLRISGIASMAALFLWVYATFNIIKHTNEITTDKKLLEYSLYKDKNCHPNEQ